MRTQTKNEEMYFFNDDERLACFLVIEHRADSGSDERVERTQSAAQRRRRTQNATACLRLSLSCDHRVSVLAWEIGKQQDDGGPGRACEGGYINLED
jgi:hypothetical protein